MSILKIKVLAARACGRLGGRSEKYGSKDIEMMKSLIESSTPIKDVSENCGLSHYNLSLFRKTVNRK
jgi:hypothetical protein